MRNIRVADRREWVATAQGDHPRRRDPETPRSRVTDWLATAPIIVLLVVAILPFAATSAAPAPTLAISPSSVAAGANATITGASFIRQTAGRLVLDGTVDLADFRASGSGGFRVKTTIPDLALGAHELTAVSKGVTLATTTITVIKATPAPTPTPTPDPTPTPAPTATPAPTPTPTPAPTASPTPAPTATPTPAPSASPTPSASASATPTPTPTPTPTATPTPTPTPTPSAGTSYYVSTTGSDTNAGTYTAPWRTIGKAATSVPAGATVNIRGGTYSGFTMTRSGTTSAWITIRAYPGESVSIVGDSTRSKVIDLNGVHYVRLSNLIVSGAAFQWGAGIYIQGGSSWVEVRDSIARNNRSYGIKLSGSNNITIAGNELTKNETGIEVSWGGSGVVIDNNDIHDNDRMIVNTVGGSDDRGANAIALYHTSGPLKVTRNRMWNNRAVSYDYAYDGGAVEIYAASGAEIAWNTMWNNENVVETGTDSSTPCDSNSFVHNVAYGGAKTGPTMGMILRCASNMLVANNTFSDLDRFVFDITASASAFGGSIEGLTLRNNLAFTSADRIYSIDSAMPASVTLDRDLAFHATGGTIAYVYGKGNTNSLATFRTWTGFETSGVQSDPRFTNRASADFTIQSTSPAIDRGVHLSGVTDGFAGAAPDLGRYEHP